MGISPCPIPCGAQARAASIYAFEISSCVFSALSFAKSGGAIYISKNGSTLAIESSIFSKCSVVEEIYYGGGIYFMGLNFEITKTCGYNCFCSFESQMFQSIASGHTHINKLSLNACSNSSIKGLSYAFWASDGTTKAAQINSTNNHLEYRGSGFCFGSQSSCDVVFANVNNCTSYDTEEGKWTAYFLYIESGSMSQSNLVSCTEGCCTSGLVTHLASCESYSMTLSECVFYENAGGPLIHGSSASIAVIDCYISHFYYPIAIGCVQTIACVMTKASSVCLELHSFIVSNTNCYFVK